MKKILLFACAALVALASCSKDPEKARTGLRKGDMVDFVLGVGADSRYSMGGGGLINVDEEKYSLRYILEIYTEADQQFFSRYERFTDLSGNSNGTSFELNLPLDEYRFVIWTDFVPKVEPSPLGNDLAVDPANATDLMYNTKNGLRKVEYDAVKYRDADLSVHPVADGGRMLRDAYSASRTISLFETAIGTMNIRRPFVRVEIVSLNMRPEDLEHNGLKAPAYMYVKYNDVHYMYDAYAQDVVKELTRDDDFYIAVTEPVGEADPYAQYLAFDYIFVAAEQPGEPGEPGDPEPEPVRGTVSFTAKAADASKAEIDLPLKIELADREVFRNTRLYVRGEFFGPALPNP